MSTHPNTLNRPFRLMSVFNDRVVQLVILTLVILTLFEIEQATASIHFTLTAIIHILPFFLAAILLAAYAKASGADGLIAGAFSGNTAIAIVAGSLAGALSPFCSCGVIPVIAGMLAAGVPLAPVMAFCIASPIMDPEMFILTAAGISVEFAVVKTITAIAMGLLAGFSVLGLQRRGYLTSPVNGASGCGCGQPAGKAARPSWRVWRDPERTIQFFTEMRSSGGFLGKWMTLAFFIESLMIAYIPAETIAGFVGTENVLAVPVSAILGIPAYMNGYAAIPLVSGLMDLGMAPGAALAFVTAGAVSSIPAAMAVYALVRRAVFLVYIATGLAGSVLAGYVYQMV